MNGGKPHKKGKKKKDEGEAIQHRISLRHEDLIGDTFWTRHAHVLLA